MKIPISKSELLSLLQNPDTLSLYDVRKEPAYQADQNLLPGAIRGRPDDIKTWVREIPVNNTVVVYCVHGHEVSQGAAEYLKGNGFDVYYLEGGHAGWFEE